METTPIVIAVVVSGIPIKLPNRRNKNTKLAKSKPKFKINKNIVVSGIPTKLPNRRNKNTKIAKMVLWFYGGQECQ